MAHYISPYNLENCEKFKIDMGRILYGCGLRIRKIASSAIDGHQWQDHNRLMVYY